MSDQGGGKLTVTLQSYNSATLAVIANLTSVYIVHPVEANNPLATSSAPAESLLESWCIFEFADARIANFYPCGNRRIEPRWASKENAVKDH